VLLAGGPAGEKGSGAAVSARADSAGRFARDDLAPGAYVVEATFKVEGPRPDFEVKVRRRVEVRAGGESDVIIGKDLGCLTLRGRLGMEGHESLGAVLLLRPASADGDEIAIQTYRDWDWKYACPLLRAGSYAVEVEHWAEGGTRTVPLGTIDVAGDLERDFEVPRAGQ
jgi:hypothetical protein